MGDEPRRRRSRRLTDEERQLWERVASSVEPMPKKRRRAKRPAAAADAAAAETSPPASEAAPPPAGANASPATVPVWPPAPAAPPKRPGPPPLAPLDRRTTQKLSRGTISIDARIDLHGMTQEAARRRLLGFLGEAQARGDKLVLVITGKGRAGRGGAEAHADPLEPGRGVLRRVVPEWLAAPGLRATVVGFSPARPEHGGDGALYVRVRRPR